MTEMQTIKESSVVRTPEKVGAEIRNLTAAAKYLTLWYAVEIGRRLTEAKALVDHGEWMDWLKQETEFSQPTASRFMKLYAEYGADQQSLFGAETKYSTLNNLSISNALRLLAVPAEEREEFAMAVDAEHISARELEQAIRERDEAKKQATEWEERAGGYASQLNDAQADLQEQRGIEEKLKARIEDLESRPVDVAVQEPDPEEIERRAAELAKAQAQEQEKKIRELEEKAKAERAKLQEKLKAAEDKLAAAGAEDRAETEQLRAQVEAMRKQLAMSGGEMVTFRLRFEAWQGAYTALQAALDQLEPEQREKCAAAVQAQIAGWRVG